MITKEIKPSHDGGKRQRPGWKVPLPKDNLYNRPDLVWLLSAYK